MSGSPSDIIVSRGSVTKRERRSRALRRGGPPPGAKGMVQSLSAEVRALARRLPQPELKWADIQFATTAISTTSSFSLLNGIAQGTTPSTRVGNKIVVKKVEINGAWVGADTTNICRMALVYDRETDGGLPTYNSSLTSDIVPGTSQPYFAPKSATTNRFTFLLDEITAVSTASPDIAVRRDIWKGSLETQYNGATGTIGFISSGSFVLFLVSDSGAVSHPTWEGWVRLWYLDV